MSLRKLLTRIVTMAGAAAYLSFSSAGAVAATLDLRDVPLFLNQAVPPFNMLVMERDHKLYYEAYNDHSDLNDDGVLDIRFTPTITYYGYFSSTLCYQYSSNRFEPKRVVSNRTTKTCGGSNEWSGNWLNYVTTARIDALRKVLYGGKRSTDSTSETVLERTHIPQDAHSWGKEFHTTAEDGYNIRDYTPYDAPLLATNRHLFASTTLSTGTTWTADNGPPTLRVLLNQPYRIWDWVSIERPVAGNGITNSHTAVTPTDFNVRTLVCTDDATLRAEEPNCQRYPNGKFKPVGLLQQYGENDRMLFGLLTGSYEKHLSGGVLRRNIGSIKNEIVANTGQFQDVATGVPGIINTMNRLRSADYNLASATTGSGVSAYTCGLVTAAPITQGQCKMWGNPIGEMMYETLRYFAGKTTPTAAFATNTGIDVTLGLPSPAWTDPYASRPVCSKPYMTVLSDINPSYDTDQIAGSPAWAAIGGQPAQAAFTGDITGLNASTEADKIFTAETSVAGKHFIGQVGGTYDGAPTAKDITSLSTIRGLSPEEPTKQGGYLSAGLSYWGNTHDVNTARSGKQNVQTFVVALASPLPRIEIKTNSGSKVTLVPFGKSVANNSVNGARGNFQPTNQIVDFYVESLTDTSAIFQVNFEDVESGNDHDMDAIVKYVVTKNVDGTITVKTSSVYAAGSIEQHMGYVISGTNGQDGIYLEVRDCDTANNAGAGGIDPLVTTVARCQGNNPTTVYRYFLNTPPGVAAGTCDAATQPASCNVNLPLTNTRTFTPGTTSGASILKDPLWFAAKWGGFQDRDNNNNLNLTEEWDADGDGDPDNYFLVTNALTLGDKLSQAFTEIDKRVSSASSVSVNSGSISSDTRLFQAKFNSGDWTGQLLAFPVTADGVLGTSVWDAATKLPAYGSRTIITRKTDGTAVPFRWDQLDSARQALLDPFAEGNGEKRLEYLRGNGANEQQVAGQPFRSRVVTKLGDIITSAPRFVGKPAFLYPDSLESEPYSEFRSTLNALNNNSGRAPMVYSGANDGMLHGFDAETGVERLAYVPSSVFKNLYLLSNPSYTHKYFVDGPPNIVDAFFGGAWHTVLAGGLNKGGQGVYALDVTRPDDFAENAASTIALWEFTDANDADLGYSFSRPVITRLANGKWVAIFGNGYNNTEADGRASTTGNAVLYIVDIADGTLIKKIDTGVGTAQDPLTQNRPNGLATPSAVDVNGDSVADYVYAGDLFGNLWKFNLRNVSPTNWGVAYSSGGNPVPLYKAVNAAGKPQPITSRPEITRGPRGAGLVVLFGTGKFLEPIDRDQANLTTMSFYGIYDRNSGGNTDVVPNRTTDATALVAQSIISEQSITYVDQTDANVTTKARVTSQLVPGAAARGWYLDLVSPSGFQGEMQVSESQLRAGKIVFTTLIPDTDPCAFGGTGWIMALDAVTGSRLSTPPFDFNHDGKFDDADTVTVTIDGQQVKIPASGLASRVGQTPEPGILSSGTIDFLFNPGTTGDIQVTSLDPGAGGFGRQSWRQIR